MSDCMDEKDWNPDALVALLHKLLLLAVTTKPVFASPYDQHQSHNGKQFTVLGLVPRERYDADECGELYTVRFADGTEIEAWPEEIFNQ